MAESRRLRWSLRQPAIAEPQPAAVRAGHDRSAAAAGLPAVRPAAAAAIAGGGHRQSQLALAAGHGSWLGPSAAAAAISEAITVAVRHRRGRRSSAETDETPGRMRTPGRMSSAELSPVCGDPPLPPAPSPGLWRRGWQAIGGLPHDPTASVATVPSLPPALSPLTEACHGAVLAVASTEMRISPAISNRRG